MRSRTEADQSAIEERSVRERDEDAFGLQQVTCRLVRLVGVPDTCRPTHDQPCADFIPQRHARTRSASDGPHVPADRRLEHRQHRAGLGLPSTDMVDGFDDRQLDAGRLLGGGPIRTPRCRAPTPTHLPPRATKNALATRARNTWPGYQDSWLEASRSSRASDGLDDRKCTWWGRETWLAVNTDSFQHAPFFARMARPGGPA